MQIGQGRHRSNSASSFLRSVAGTCIGVVALSCARAEDPPVPPSSTDVEGERESLPAAYASSDRDTDAGKSSHPADASAGCSGSECPECPAPLGGMTSTGSAVWSRNPETRECCRYDNLAEAPPWPYFDTEAACQSDCRCSVLEGFIEDVGLYDTARSSLDCRCSAETCPATISDAEQLLCNRAAGFGGVQRREGCGRVLVIDRNGYAGDGWVFEAPMEPTDAATPRLVGAIKFGDVNFAPCQTYVWVAGSDFDCDSTVTCQLCGESPGAPVPPCE